MGVRGRHRGENAAYARPLGDDQTRFDEGGIDQAVQGVLLLTTATRQIVYSYVYVVGGFIPHIFVGRLDICSID